MTTNKGSKILPCDCKHTGQDSVYGKGMRLHNLCDNINKEPMKAARCTVCGKEKSI